MAERPFTTTQWVLESQRGTSGLRIKTDVPLPAIGPYDVLIKICAVSLNSRDSQIVNNTYIWGSALGVVPLSDAAGTIIAIGGCVTRFTTGARVMATFHRNWLSGRLSSLSQASDIGARTDGLLQTYTVLHQDDLVTIPKHLTFTEASTLPCAAVTAWNALFASNPTVKPGDIVLVQGSGSVSLFALQFAVAAGATVIATTGEVAGEREAKLRKLGARTVLNYNDADWGKKVKEVTGGRGADFIVEVSGAAEQSASALRIGGQVAIVGGVGASGGSLFDMRKTLGELRRIFVGSREDFEDMNRAIEANHIVPIVDSRVWKFEQAKEAFEYAATGVRWGKVVIQIAQD